MPWVEDLETILVNKGVGIAGTSIFRSSAADIPTGDGPYVEIRATGGTTPDFTQNSAPMPAYHHPGAQIIVHAKKWSVAEAKAIACRNAFNSIRDEIINGTYYLKIGNLNEPNDGGADDTKRVLCKFNVMGWKRPEGVSEWV